MLSNSWLSGSWCVPFQNATAVILYEAKEDERAKMCFVVHNAHSVQYFPLI